MILEHCIHVMHRVMRYPSVAERMSVNEAANHEFLAPELGLKFVRPISLQSN